MSVSFKFNRFLKIFMVSVGIIISNGFWGESAYAQNTNMNTQKTKGKSMAVKVSTTFPQKGKSISVQNSPITNKAQSISVMVFDSERKVVDCSKVTITNLKTGSVYYREYAPDAKRGTPYQYVSPINGQCAVGQKDPSKKSLDLGKATIEVTAEGYKPLKENFIIKPGLTAIGVKLEKE